MSQEEKVVNDLENQVVTEENNAPNSEQAAPEGGEVCDNMAEEVPQNSDIEADLAEEVKVWQDKYARLSAEFDNYRKRTLKEKMELIESAGEDVIKSILTVVDDFDRAAAASATSDDAEVLKSGMALIHKRLVDTLKQKGVVEIEAKGVDLDTDFHDAIAKFAVAEDQKGKVIDVVEKGYKLKDKVIRFAKVVIGE